MIDAINSDMLAPETKSIQFSDLVPKVEPDNDITQISEINNNPLKDKYDFIDALKRIENPEHIMDNIDLSENTNSKLDNEWLNNNLLNSSRKQTLVDTLTKIGEHDIASTSWRERAFSMMNELTTSAPELRSNKQTNIDFSNLSPSEVAEFNNRTNVNLLEDQFNIMQWSNNVRAKTILTFTEGFIGISKSSMISNLTNAGVKSISKILEK